MSGPDGNPWTGQSIHRTARSKITIGPDDCFQSILINGESQPLPQSNIFDGAPSLLEETIYQISIVDLQGGSPEVHHRDPNILKHISLIDGANGVISGTLNFRSQIGFSTFRIENGFTFLRIAAEVCPTKMDYRTDYEDILADLGSIARNLIFEYLRATDRATSHDSSVSDSSLEWLISLRGEIERLENALNYIVHKSHMSLVPTISYEPIQKIRRSSNVTRRAVQRTTGFGPLVGTTGIGVHRKSLPSVTSVATTNTAENAWLRLQLSSISSRLKRLRANYDSLEKNGHKSSDRNSSIQRELTRMLDTLSAFMDKDPFRSALREVPPDFSSLTMQGAPGYREAYQSILHLRMALMLEGDVLKTSITDLAELYEVWCYLAIIQIVSRLTGTPTKLEDLLEFKSSGVSMRLRPGRSSSVEISDTNGCVKISYNRPFAMQTGVQRPDITIEIARANLAPIYLLMDAKYRLNATSQAMNSRLPPGPPIDAIGQLHRYRDAILIDTPSRGRPVVRAVALFPLNSSNSEGWCDHPLYKSNDEVGIGALPFLPTNLRWVTQWIKEALEAPYEELAWPGPPHLAWNSIKEVTK